MNGVPLPDTIVACATPPGGALALVRVSGPRAFAVGRALLFRRDGRPRFPEGAPIPPRRMIFAVARDSAGPFDEALAHFAVSPASYTGEDTLEITCHGGAPTVARLLAACRAAGCRMAGPGEFTRRAFLNGRIDLLRAEAVGDLCAARTERARAAAFLQGSGAHAAALCALRGTLLDLSARVEAWLDHPEEDVEPAAPDELAGRLRAIESALDAALSRARGQIALREGAEIALLGRANAGKSSLFNRLLARDRAIVDPAPGTTRDVVSEPADLAGFPVLLHDTAGLRATEGGAEAEGIRRTRALAAAVPLRLVVFDGSAPASADDREALAAAPAPRILVINKIDLPRRFDPALLPSGEPPVEVSCATGAGIDRLIAEIGRALGDAPPEEGLVVTNARQAECLADALAAVREAAGALATGLPFDLAADSLRRAARAVSAILGDDYTEELLDRIFAKFCIGK